MKHYKLREGESIRKPVVKRDSIEIRVPVLLICLALAFGVWLYVVSLSKIDPAHPLDTIPVTEEETADAADTVDAAAEPAETEDLLDVGADPASADPAPAANGSDPVGA